MSSAASRHHSPVAACQRLHVGQPVSRSPQWSISTKGRSHCLQRLDGMVTIHFDASAIWACPIHLTDLHLPQDQLQTLATFQRGRTIPSSLLGYLPFAPSAHSPAHAGGTH